MDPDVGAFFTDQDECMNVVYEDFQDVLTQTARPLTPARSASTSLQSPVPEVNSSIKASRPTSATATKAREDVSSASLLCGSKRRGDELSSPAGKRCKKSKETKLNSSPIRDHSSPQVTRSHARRKHKERATKPSSKPTNLPLDRADSTSSIEEITFAEFPGSVGKSSTTIRRPVQESHANVEPADVIPAVAGPSRMVLPPSGDQSSALALQMASRVASLKHKSSRPQAKARQVRNAVPVEQSIATASPMSSPVSPGSSSSPPLVRTSGNKLKKTPPQQGLPKRPTVKPAKKPTPEEHARHLLENPQVQLKPVVKFLRGMNIFYCGGEYDTASEMTMNRMKILVKFGANLQPKYDADQVSHIVVDKHVGLGVLVSKIGLKHHREIPDRIPTVLWDWVADGVGPASKSSDPNKVIILKPFWQHAAYLERFDAGHSSDQRHKSGRSLTSHTVSFKVNHDEEDFDSDREDYGPLPGPSSEDHSVQKASSSSELTVEEPQVFKPSPDDPLAEFYAQATAEHNEQWSRHGEVDADETDDSDSETSASRVEEVARKTTKSANWTCDKPGSNECPNQLIVDLFSKLQKLHEKKFDPENCWRVLSYKRVIRAVKAYPTKIKSYAEAVAIKYVGPESALKILEIIHTGKLSRIDYENTDDVKVMGIFQGIYGVGPLTALKWYYKGARTLEDLREGKFRIKLSEAQRIGLDNYDDINSRMPRDEAKALFDLIKPIALKIDPKLFVEIMGSYRRGKADCGDIDIMITRDPSDGRTHAGVLAKLLQKLHDVEILTDDLALPENPWNLEAIYRGLCRLPKAGSQKRRIDFLTVPWKSRGAALLYYTGDDIFNRAMRLKANHAGYSLNQRGLFEGVIRNPSNRTIKLDAGILRASETEEEIFEILEVPWQAPHERVRNFS